MYIYIFIYFLNDFIEREHTGRDLREEQREREKQRRECDAGLNSRTVGS